MSTRTLTTPPVPPLINRAHVAAAFDRAGAAGPDGLVSADELKGAGITRVDPRALAVINEPGEAGDTITVSELARALTAERVAVTSKGMVVLEGGKGTFVDGRIDPAAPWPFPEVADLALLEGFHRLIPRLGRYHPSNPDGYYEDRVMVGYERVKVGQRRVYDGTDADGNAKYRYEDVYENRPKYEDQVNYTRLRRDLEPLARRVLDAYAGAEDPAVKAAYENLKAVLASPYPWNASACRAYYAALDKIDDIAVPTRPRVHVERLHATLEKTALAIEEQARIASEIPLERARAAIEREVARLKATDRGDLLTGAVPAVLAGGAGFALLGGLLGGAALLAGLSLVAAVGALAAVAGGAGWLASQYADRRRAAALEKDLATLEAIDPVENREEMEQHALAAYRLLQDAKDADFLAAVRAFQADAANVASRLGVLAARAEKETASLKDVEALVRRYAA